MIMFSNFPVDLDFALRLAIGLGAITLMVITTRIVISQLWKRWQQ